MLYNIQHIIHLRIFKNNHNNFSLIIQKYPKSNIRTCVEKTKIDSIITILIEIQL